MKKKVLASVAAALVLCCVNCGTLAWLTDKTDSVVNTFTVGNVDIELKETTENYKMIPGCTIAKDPTVTVTKDSEDCWLFVKVEKSENFDTFMTYDMANGWTPLEGESGVFYHQVTNSAADQTFAVLKDNSVTVNDTVDKAMMDDLKSDTFPTLTFTVYAVQQHKSSEADFSPAEAWKTVSAA